VGLIGSTCTAVPWTSAREHAILSAFTSSRTTSSGAPSSTAQGHTPVHFLVQRKRFVWSRGCIWGLFRECVLGIRGYEGVSRVYFVPETAQVELKTGRV